MKTQYIERIYAGWLAKIIGIRLGAPIEGWTYEMIKNVYGELSGYPVDYREFAADDDSNGPFFFLRALAEGRNGFDLKAQDVAEALLNYAPFEHGFFWWGGYGVSTEHTAYLNLKYGMKAPESGSLRQNGAMVAEQIGGQIFIDTWGLVTPGNPDLAAKFAREAASVTHDGNGIYGGIFVATCISYAFEEHDIKKIIEKGLSYIPLDSEYTRVVRSVMDYYTEKGGDWRECFAFVKANFGYDKYPGNCHIIPNIAVMILSLLYGEGDFSNTLNICNMCGWDTDCNVGNVATIMGVRNGVEGIDYNTWRKPINDFFICSSVIGSLNILDIPFVASYIAKLAYAVAGEDIPVAWRPILENGLDALHFEYPGSTQAMRVRKAFSDPAFSTIDPEISIMNTEESAASGKRSLKMVAKPVVPAEQILLYKKTYYHPEDFNDSRYDPCFSPLIYSGQTIHGSAFLPDYSCEATVCLYVKEERSGKLLKGEKVVLKKGEWTKLTFAIPKKIEGVLLSEMGFCFEILGKHKDVFVLTALVDDLYAEGKANYTIDFSKETEEVWTGIHREISQFTKLKGLMYLSDDQLHLSCSDFAEAYTGRYDWTDYACAFTFTPLTGEHHYLNVRVQGGIRSYAFGMLPNGTVGLLKNDNGYSVLCSEPFDWELGKEYTVTIQVTGTTISADLAGGPSLQCTDENYPYMKGSIGMAMENGSHAAYRKIVIS